MSNVININIKSNDNEGYILNGRSVEGVYVGDLTASITDDGKRFIVGLKEDRGIIGQTITLEELNRFCIMHLAIFYESVLVKE